MKQRAPSFRRHVSAHEAVLNNEYWYGDGLPHLGNSFTAAKTAERHGDVVDLLQRAAKRHEATGDQKQSRLLWKLANKIEHCRRRHRCGSLACPQCVRAFQRAKTTAQEQVILGRATTPVAAPTNTNTTTTSRILVMVTVIPLSLTYIPAELVNLDIPKRNRWLKDVLTQAGLNRMMVGSADIGWEYRRGKHYYQLHWHIAMWTKNRERLQRQLLRLFPPKKRYDRPVEVSKSFNLGFLSYMNKALKLPDLLRRNRRDLPQLLLALDGMNPLDLTVISGLRLSAQSGRLVLRRLRHREMGAK